LESISVIRSKSRLAYYNPDSSDRDVLELIVGKARHGLTGTARFLFDKSYGLLTELPGGNHGN